MFQVLKESNACLVRFIMASKSVIPSLPLKHSGVVLWLYDVEKEKGMHSERLYTTLQHVWNELFFPFSELFHYHFYYMRKLQMIF